VEQQKHIRKVQNTIYKMGCMRYLSEAHLRGFERYKVSSSKKGVRTFRQGP